MWTPEPSPWPNQITDIDREIRFYTELRRSRARTADGAVFASVSRGPLRLPLSGPQLRRTPMPDGRRQGPGGWNRIVSTSTTLPLTSSDSPRPRPLQESDREWSGGRRSSQTPDGNPSSYLKGPGVARKTERTPARGGPPPQAVSRPDRARDGSSDGSVSLGQSRGWIGSALPALRKCQGGGSKARWQPAVATGPVSPCPNRVGLHPLKAKCWSHHQQCRFGVNLTTPDAHQFLGVGAVGWHL